MAKSEQGAGTVRPIRDRKTGAVIGYQALLPRLLSKVPPNCKKPKAYQQPIGPRCAKDGEARAILTAAIKERINTASLVHGLTFSHYLRQEIEKRHRAALEVFAEHDFRGELSDLDLKKKADHHLAAWRSADRVHFRSAPFYDLPPNRIEIEALQKWINWLRYEHTSARTGSALAKGSIANMGEMLRAVFVHAEIKPNPMDSVELPKKAKKPHVRSLALAEQRRFFGSNKIPLRDRVMAGCQMGAALRIGELISLEVENLFLDAHDPHIDVRYGGRKRSPTKGRAVKRVELFEPGLGFFRLWMRDHYRGGERVFEGAKGGVLSAWTDNFKAWTVTMGKKMTSHIMRHTYAVSMLSGSWGYEPQTLDFVQHQLRHSSRAVTEKYYAGLEDGALQRQVRHMTGRAPRCQQSEGVTAANLLGISDASIDVSPPKIFAISGNRLLDGQVRNGPNPSGESAQSDALAHQSLARSFLRALDEGDPFAGALAIRLAQAVLAGESSPLRVAR